MDKSTAGFAKQASKVKQLGCKKEPWSQVALGLPSWLAGRHTPLTLGENPSSLQESSPFTLQSPWVHAGRLGHCLVQRCPDPAISTPTVQCFQLCFPPHPGSVHLSPVQLKKHSNV